MAFLSSFLGHLLGRKNHGSLHCREFQPPLAELRLQSGADTALET